jgi:RimJ/RimL family protein N-acetyltransferase
MPETNLSGQPITIRPATVEDAPALRLLRLEALQNKPEAFASDFEKESKETVGDWEGRLANQLENVIFVAVADSALVGMTGIGRDHHTKMSHGGWIWGVYVQPAWRGRRISDQMIEACMRWAKKESLKNIKLGVATTNITAINSYLRSGFRVYGVDPQVLFWNGVYYDEFLMVRDV